MIASGRRGDEGDDDDDDDDDDDFLLGDYLMDEEGSEGFEDTEPPRPEFKGKVVVNEETGREDVVISNYPLLLLKKIFSYAVIFVCMVVTVTLAFRAMALKNHAPRALRTSETPTE